MHFVGLALEPFEKSAHAVPAIVLRQLFDVGVFVTRLAVDDEILIGLRQVLEGSMDVDLFPGAGPHEIALRFAHFFAAKNTDGALCNAERAIGDGAIQVDRDRAAEAAAFWARAKRIVKTEKPRSRRTDIEIAVRAMPAGGERMRDEG